MVHWQTNDPSLLIHFPPFLHGFCLHSFKSVEQVLPVHPGIQVHENLPFELAHVPRFLQGKLAQGFV